MNTLLIDTHDRELLLAIYKDEKLKWKKEIKEQLDHSTVCMPSLVALLNEASLTIHDINDIVVVNGPGSFTGVRLGVTIAKILSYTLQIPIRSITSLELYEYPSDAIYGVLKEKNGYYVAQRKNEMFDFYNYLKKDEFFSWSKNKNFAYGEVIDYENLVKKAHLKEAENAHTVNPFYVKKIGVQE